MQNQSTHESTLYRSVISYVWPVWLVCSYIRLIQSYYNKRGVWLTVQYLWRWYWHSLCKEVSRYLQSKQLNQQWWIFCIKFFQAPPWNSADVKYVLLTKPVVEMTGYWPNWFLFVCVFYIDREELEVIITQYRVSSKLVNKRFIIWHKDLYCFLWDQYGKSRSSRSLG